MKLKFFLFMFIVFQCCYANNIHVKCTESSNSSYLATKWYRDSAEKNALYREIFAMGFQRIIAQVKAKKMKPGEWGVVFDIDETLLDNSQYDKETIQKCEKDGESGFQKFANRGISVATPGASKITCAIKESGGDVILVTNRIGNYDGLIQGATISNLKKAKICFDSVIFESSGDHGDKNARFNAILSGNYAGLMVTNKLPAIKVIAYFGDNIQDFPKLKQKNAILQNKDGDFFESFGQMFFSLPNPMYGSWMGNKFE